MPPRPCSWLPFPGLAFQLGRSHSMLLRRLPDATCKTVCEEGKWIFLIDATRFAKELTVSSADASPPTGPTPQDLKSALKAFRKRLKLTQLDDQSRLGYGPMTGGQQSSIVAITPPDQFPAAVWEELARQGKLKRAGSGMYSLGQP